MPFSFFDHTGDIGLEVEGASVGELFADAAAGLTAATTELSLVEPRTVRQVALDAPALDRALVDWLSELVFRFETDRFLVRRADVEVAEAAGGVRVNGTLHGEVFDPGRHPIAVLIKGVTYHGLHVTAEGGRWRARVILDI